MSILVRIGDTWRAVTDVTSTYAFVEGACPHCKTEPLKVRGTGRRPSQDDRAYEADGFCVDCREPVGLIRNEVETLFGVREDEAVVAEVTRGGATVGRVYGGER